jgi:hypothetical protein
MRWYNVIMLLVTSLLRWWYGDGWRQRTQLVANRLDGTIDYFSFDLLVKTLFAPFRQISAGKVDGPLNMQMRAMVDRMFSRVIGAAVRLILLVIGGIVIGVQVIIGFVVLIGWALVPVAPIIGLVLALTGWAF